MALGDWLDAKPSEKQSLKADLQEIDRQLAELAARPAPQAVPAFHRVSGEPSAALGNDGDTALDTVTGYFWARDGGAWAIMPLSVWSD